MKRKIWIWLTTCLCAVCLALGVGCSKESLQLNKTSLALNLYDEVLLTVESDEVAEWSSSDEEIVKVSADGLVMAQGVKGEATITVKTESGKAKCEVTVRDRFIEPALETEDARAFVNGLSDAKVLVNYNDVLYTPDSVSLFSADETIVTVENGRLKGLQEGETEIAVEATWKKWTASDTVKVTVYGEKVMFLEEEEISIFDVPDGTLAKRNSYTVTPEVFVQGALQEGSVTLTQTSGDVNSVTITGNTVKVAENYTPDTDGEQVAITVETSVAGVEAKTLTVNVMPNYIVVDPLDELVDTKKADVKVKAYEGTDENITENGTREGIADYTISNVKANQNVSNNAWAHWNTRLELMSTRTTNGHTKYDSLKENGYKMVSFDVYYTNANGADSLHGMFFGMNGCSSYFRTDSQNNRDDMFIVNAAGEITNTLKANEWQTVYLDIEKLAVASLTAGKEDCNIFIACNYVNNVAYIDDLRYWFDTTIINSRVGTDKDMRDMAARTLTQDSQNAAKYAAQANEFIAFAPNAYVEFKAVENGEGEYKYDNAGAKAFEIETKSKLNAYNDLNGNAVKEGYRYITFDLKVESGENLLAPKLSYYDLYKQSTYAFTLQADEKVQSTCLRLFQGGKEIYQFETDTWITVALRIDGKAKENFYLTAKKDFGSNLEETEDDKTSVFYLKNTNYYKDDSYINEYAYNDLLRASFDGLDRFYYVNDTLDLREVLDVRFGGEKISDYEIVECGETSVNSYADGVITVTALGTGTVTVGLERTVDGVTHPYTVTFTLNVVPDSRVELKYDSVELYSGAGEYGLEKARELSVKMYENQVQLGSDRERYEIVSGAEYITLENGRVAAKANAVGEACVRVWFETTGGEVIDEDTIQIVTFDTFRSRGNDEFVWGNRVDENITYGEADETVGGRTGAYKYYAANANASWNDRLMIYETGHKLGEAAHEEIVAPYGSATAAFNNLTQKSIAYITFDMYLTVGSLMRVNALENTGVKDQRNYYQAGSKVGEVQPSYYNDNIGLYNGSRALKKGETIAANTWYTVVVDYKTAVLKEGWAALHLSGGGTVYLDNVRYYHDESWMLDFAADEALVLAAAIEEKCYAGESMALADIATATYLKQEVGEGVGEWTVAFGDATVASYDAEKKTINFLKAGVTSLTVTVELNGKTASKELELTVKPANRIELVKEVYELWDNSVVSGEDFPAETDILANVKIDNDVVDDARFTVLGYDGDDIVELVDGLTLRAKAQGTAIVTIAYEEDESVTTEITVRVYGSYKQEDGGELMMARTVDATYEPVSGEVYGRTGVYAYTDSSITEWSDTLVVKESAHPFGVANGAIPNVNSTTAYQNMTDKNYDYVAIDVCLTSGALLRVTSMNATSDQKATRRDYYVGKTLEEMAAESTEANNDLISIYHRGVALKETDYIFANRWYTVIVDRVNSQAPADNDVWSAICFSGTGGTVYFDTVRYYFDDSCYEENTYAQKTDHVGYDGSELVPASALATTSSYEKVTTGTYAGKYKFTANGAAWADKIGVYETNHNQTKAYNDAVWARKNMLAKNYKFVTFDICVEQGGVVICAPNYTVSGTTYTWVGQSNIKLNDDNSIGTGNPYVTLYDGNGNEVTGTFQDNVWYTVLVEYVVDPADAAGAHWAGIDIGNLVAGTVAYFDNVRYYGENPFVTA